MKISASLRESVNVHRAVDAQSSVSQQMDDCVGRHWRRLWVLRLLLPPENLLCSTYLPSLTAAPPTNKVEVLW